MNTKYISRIILILVIVTTLTIGCRIESKSDDTLAYISHSKNSEYEKTFDELQLGTMFNYKYKLENANTTSVQGWLELYENGKIVDRNIDGFSYIVRPEKKGEEGNLGFGTIESIKSNSLIFFYSPAFTMAPRDIEYDLNKSDGINVWHNAINNQTLSIKEGEEVILAVYREIIDDEVIKYNYQNSDDIEKIIKEDNRVVLFKFKIDEKSN